MNSDRERCGDAEAADEPDAHEEHAEQRDDDRRAGEHDRTAGGVHRDADRLADVVPRVQLLAVAGDDEQRVVDADAEADHDADERREVGDLEDVAGDDHRRAAEADAGERGADRQAHRQHRAEGDDEDDDGEREAEQLGRRLLELGEEVAAELDAHALLLRHQLLDLVADLGGAREVDVLGEVHRRVGDGAGRRRPPGRSGTRRPVRTGSAPR